MESHRDRLQFQSDKIKICNQFIRIKLGYPSLNGSGDLVAPFLDPFEDFVAETHACEAIAEFLLALLCNWKRVVIFKSIHFWHSKTILIYRRVFKALFHIQY